MLRTLTGSADPNIVRPDAAFMRFTNSLSVSSVGHDAHGQPVIERVNGLLPSVLYFAVRAAAVFAISQLHTPLPRSGFLTR